MAKDRSSLQRPRDFFRQAKESKIGEQARRKIAEEEEKSGLLDHDALEEQEAWGFLANKVVGSEGE